MSNDLIKRLRAKPKYSGFSNQGEIEYTKSLHHESADRIEALQAENARLQEMVEKRHANPADFRYWEGRYRDEAAENERLRGIVEKAYHEGWGHGAISSGRRDMHNIHAEAERDWNGYSRASAALQQDKEGE